MNTKTSSVRRSLRAAFTAPLWLAALFLWCQPGQAPAAGSPTTAVLRQIRAPLAGPARVCTDASGRLYASDPRGGQVAVYDAFGRLLSVKAGLAGPLGVAVDHQGRIYVAEETAGRVSIYDASWSPLGFLGNGDQEFAMPNHIAISESGGVTTVYVSDSLRNVVKGYVNGTLARTVGGPGQFDFPTGVYVNAGGELLVVDQNNDQVEVFDAAGIYLRSFRLKPGSAQKSGKSQGMAGDALGRLYIADSFQGYVRVFASDGTPLSQVGAYGGDAGSFRTPMSVATDSWGRLFVASVNNSRIEVLGLDCFTQMEASPATQVVGTGQTATFTIVSGCADATVQWRKGTNALVDGGRISGSTNKVLVLSGVTAAEAGEYSALITSGTNVLMTPAATLQVLAGPAIVQQPANATVKQGGTANFTVLTTGTELTYSWRYNGSAIPGATSSALRLTDVQPPMRGNYSVAVSNTAGGVVSSAAVLSVIEAPFFTLQPPGQSVPEYGAFTLSAVAGGSTPISYQWYRGGLSLGGRTTGSTTFSNVSPALNGSYYMVASNLAGWGTSQVAVVTVVPDTVAPRVLSASGGRNESRWITIAFTEPVSTATAVNPANYTLTGSAGLSIVSATVSNATNVVLTLSGIRTPGLNYQLTVRNVADMALTPNVLAPNPTTVQVLMNIDLVTINGTSWKHLAPTNNMLDSQGWKAVVYNDAWWSNGFGIFYGNRTNSVTQPLPNPNVRLPFSLSASDPNNTRVYTVLNLFTNSANAIRTTTYYFRTTFNFPAETTNAALLLHAIIDDGAVVYLNGVEARRDRMAAGTPVFSTLASGSGSQAWSPAVTASGTSIPLTGLRKGTNVVAIELHQRTTTDDDVTLGFWLEGVIPAYAVQPSPKLGMQRSAATGDIAITWDQAGWTLEAAPGLSGPWTPAASTSGYLVPGTQAQGRPAEYFRLRRVQ